MTATMIVFAAMWVIAAVAIVAFAHGADQRDHARKESDNRNVGGTFQPY